MEKYLFKTIKIINLIIYKHLFELINNLNIYILQFIYCKSKLIKMIYY
jgi:hypothetical protein